VFLGKATLLTDARRSAWANQKLLEDCSALTAEELEHDFRISHGTFSPL
jgi:uncharacterized damage-inducible protein DinB